MTDSATLPPRSRATLIGIGLAASIMIGWIIVHVVLVFGFTLTAHTAILVPFTVALQTWLTVGLFIVAHDAIHGTIAPGKPSLNRLTGWTAITLYGGFNYDKLAEAHHRHHRYSGTEADPDFCVHYPKNPIFWAFAFFRRHTTLRPLIFIQIVFNVELHLLGAPLPNLLLFYCAPALLSAFQLFYFGTYLPHRHEDEDAFADRHRARSSSWGPLFSLLSCYHFGYHHEHHAYPYVPWWKLPSIRWRAARAE